ncbi:MAG: VWA domain-containing protein [Vicinamibacterales bacterium]
MTPRLLPSTAIGLAIAVATIQAGGQLQPTFRSGTGLVVVPVVVIDKAGRDVTTLDVRDFEVREDGQPVAIETFVAPGASDAESGRFVVVVMDNVNVAPERFWRVRAIAGTLVDRLGPDDRMAVVALAGGRAADTSSRAVLKAAVARVGLSASGDVHSAERNADDGLRALADLAGQIAESPHRRKVLVIIGAAWIFNPNRASAFADRDPDLSPLWREATERMGAANASLYVIDPGGFTGSPQDYATSFAAQTGGLAWTNTNAYDKAIDRLWRDAGTYYLIGYRAPSRDGRPHDIDVRVTGSGLTVRARRTRG